MDGWLCYSENPDGSIFPIPDPEPHPRETISFCAKRGNEEGLREAAAVQHAPNVAGCGFSGSTVSIPNE